MRAHIYGNSRSPNVFYECINYRNHIVQKQNVCISITIIAYKKKTSKSLVCIITFLRSQNLKIRNIATAVLAATLQQAWVICLYTV